jgi:hypothetical protein
MSNYIPTKGWVRAVRKPLWRSSTGIQMGKILGAARGGDGAPAVRADWGVGTSRLSGNSKASVMVPRPARDCGYGQGRVWL